MFVITTKKIIDRIVTHRHLHLKVARADDKRHHDEENGLKLNISSDLWPLIFNILSRISHANKNRMNSLIITCLIVSKFRSPCLRVHSSRCGFQGGVVISDLTCQLPSEDESDDDRSSNCDHRREHVGQTSEHLGIHSFLFFRKISRVMSRNQY